MHNQGIELSEQVVVLLEKLVGYKFYSNPLYQSFERIDDANRLRKKVEQVIDLN